MKSRLIILLLILCLNSFGQKLPISPLCWSDIRSYFSTGGGIPPACLVDAFSRATPSYFDPTYAKSGGDWLSEFRNYGANPDYPIYYLGSKSEVAMVDDPAVSTFTISSDATFLVVCIKSIFYPNRGSAAPTWNGTPLTQAGTYNGYLPSEVWYLVNPTTGTHDLSVANNTNLHILSSWHKSEGGISLHSTGYNAGTSTNVSASTAIQTNTNLLILDCVTYLYNSSSLEEVNSTDTELSFGVIGGTAGSSTQYKIYKPTSGTTYSPEWNIVNSKTWYSVVVCFKSN